MSKPGSVLKAFRKKHGMSQEELAQLLFMSDDMISRRERGIVGLDSHILKSLKSYKPKKNRISEF